MRFPQAKIKNKCVCVSTCVKVCVCSRLLLHQHNVAERREYYLPRRGPGGLQGLMVEYMVFYRTKLKSLIEGYSWVYI